MKNPNQITRNVKRAASAAQPKARRTAPQKSATPVATASLTTRGIRRLAASDSQVPITTEASAATGVPGAIYRLEKAPQKIKTGRLIWTPAQLTAALAARQFLVTRPNKFHCLALRKFDHSTDRFYAEFLTLLTSVDVAMLRGSVPLYWIRPQSDDGLLLVSLRGEPPPKARAKFGARTRHLPDEELRRRDFDENALDMLDDVETITRTGTPEQKRLLGAFLDAMSAMIEAAKSTKGGAK